jgi:hypothetical protein
LSEPRSELRNNDEFPELESRGDHFFAEGRDVVLIRMADFLDEPMCSEAFEET